MNPQKQQNYRIETDSLGQLKIPTTAYWGAQTQRAIENFPISGIPFPREFIQVLGLMKMIAAETNIALGLLENKSGQAIQTAAQEVAAGEWDAHFPVDVFQTGSGTSTNMNANEVIANRANEILGFPLGNKSPVHPNDHVNMGQSSNDVIPTCIHLATAISIQENSLLNDPSLNKKLSSGKKQLLPVLSGFQQALLDKEKQFAQIVKLGRTHLQDAVPVRLGQEFSGYATMVERGIERIQRSIDDILELALGGTAVGTGLNTHPKFAKQVIRRLNKITGLNFREAKNHFEAQGARDAIVQVSGSLKTLAASISKIANDIRWMGAGPYGGIGELQLPAVQPGSSIMPGKVNPVMAESIIQVAAQVIACDTAITLGGGSGNFELNAMMPLMAHNLLFSIRLLTNGVDAFTSKCVRGLQADEQRCRELLEKSPALVTILAPIIGYDQAAKIAAEAKKKNLTIKEVIINKNILPAEQVEKMFDPGNF